MNNQEIQIILGILLLLIYVFFIRNKEGYRGRVELAASLGLSVGDAFLRE